jgi:predicted AAA+ superfamily ATPase
MKKRFNVTGVCFPERHYMADTTAKYARIWEMIEQGDYFTINRPRQYGKTTALFQLAAQLNGSKDYLALRISFEGLGEIPFESESALSSVFLKNIAAYCQRVNPALAVWIEA